MTLHIIIGILIGFGLYMFFSKRNQKENLQSVSNQRISEHHAHNESNNNNSTHKHKKGHGCC